MFILRVSGDCIREMQEDNNKCKLEYQAYLPYAALLMLAAYFCYRQMRTGNIIIGSDTIFHYNRFYETAQQIKHGNFNWFMTMYGFSHSGRVINALYVPLSQPAVSRYAFGHEVTDPDKHKIKWTKSGLIALTPARKKLCGRLTRPCTPKTCINF